MIGAFSRLYSIVSVLLFLRRLRFLTTILIVLFQFPYHFKESQSIYNLTFKSELLWSLFNLYWILKAIFLISLLYLKTTYLLSLIFFFLFSFFWIITCYFFFLPLFFLIVVCWFFFFSFYQEWTTSFCLKCFGIHELKDVVNKLKYNKKKKYNASSHFTRHLIKDVYTLPI